MSEKFLNKYRVETARAQWHNYNGGAYFITICAKNHRHYFGEIIGEEMRLSAIGKMTNQYWQEIPIYFNQIELGPCIVMPNHIHGIIFINDISNFYVSEPEAIYMKRSSQSYKNRSSDLASAIGEFKSSVTKYAHSLHQKFEWQPRYYDRIIRNQEELNNIADYINNNVMSWAIDRLNVDD